MPPQSNKTKKDLAALVPALNSALHKLQDEIAAKCRAMPGPFVASLAKVFDSFEPEFSLAPFIQGLLIATATLSKKRVLIFLLQSASRPFPRYLAHWHTCIAERNNAKSFLEEMVGVPMMTEVMDFFKSSKSATIRKTAQHLDGLDDGSSKNVTNDAASTLIYKLAGANERLNSWTTVTDEAETFVQRLEDSSSMSEARFLTTSWDAGRRLSKGDSATDCLSMHWQFILLLIMQPALKIREIVFETVRPTHASGPLPPHPSPSHPCPTQQPTHTHALPSPLPSLPHCGSSRPCLEARL